MTHLNAYHKSIGPGWKLWCPNYLPALQYLYPHKSKVFEFHFSHSFTLGYKEYLSNICCYLFCTEYNKHGQQYLPDSAYVEPPLQLRKQESRNPAWLCLFLSHISPYISPVFNKSPKVRNIQIEKKLLVKQIMLVKQTPKLCLHAKSFCTVCVVRFTILCF